jgi:D-alanyl-D-alanine carboxypeptidase
VSQTTAARTTTRRTLGPNAVGLVVVCAAIIGALVYRSTSSSAPSFSEAHSPAAHGAVPQSASSSAPSFSDVHGVDRVRATNEGHGAITEDDGALPDGVTVFDDEYPGVTNLDPDLLQALREAAADASDDGIELYVTSGWRSPEYQNQLLREAVSRYGSVKEAARWVATADTSPHVSGDAVDIGSVDATAWLSEHGAEYGLCQIYRNEPWHYELRPAAIDRACPQMYADPSHDPRMQQ